MNYPFFCKTHLFKCLFLFVTLIIILVFPEDGLPQKEISTKPTIEYSFKRYTLHDGLIQMQVTALYQDEKGFLWCGTKGGISRFDGKTFKNYSKTEAKLSGLVIKFGQDSNNNLLIFHPSGVTIFDGKSFFLYPFEDGWYIPDQNSNYLTDNYFLLYKKINDRQISCRIAKFQDFKIVNSHEFKPGENINQINAVSDFFNNNLAWIISKKKAVLTNLETWQAIDSISGDQLNIIFRFQENTYSIKKDGIHLFQNNISKHTANANLIASFPKPILSQDGQSVFLKDRDGVYHFKDDSLYTINNHLTYVRDLLFDYEGNLWVATEEGLLNFFQLDFKNYHFLPDSPDYVWTIVEDSKNNMWFGSYTNGLWTWDGEKITDYNKLLSNKFSGQTHFYMGASKFENNIYFPVIQRVIQYDGHHFSEVEGTAGSAYLFTRALDDGTLLCTGHNGLTEININKEPHYWSIETLNVSKVTTVNTDKYGRYIVGGYTGISIVDGDKIACIDEPYLKNILCMEKDDMQNLWIGGINESLFFFDGDSIQQVINIKDNAIHSMLFLEPNVLLLGCRNGLFVFDIAKYYETGETTLIEYNQNNGFVGLECGQNAFLQDSNKDVWIATSDLVTKFDPQSINRQPATPKIYIESIEVSKNKIDWIEVDTNKKESFKYNNNSIKINFTSVCFSAIGNVNFFYSLTGVQDGWSQPQKNKEVIFYNLKNRNYTFYLKANNGASDVETEVITINFEIRPAIWQQKWAIALFILFAILIIFLSVRLYYNHRLRKKEKELALEKIRTGLQVRALDSKSNHHFIFNILNNIGFNIIQKETDEAYNLFSKLSWFFRLSLKSPDSITTTLSHQIETVNDYLFLQKNRLGDRLDYKIEMNYPELKNNEMPRNILQTIVDNSVTHGIEPKDDGGFVEIKVTIEDGNMIVTVTDNGIGRQKSKNINTHKKHGLGLNIYKRFFELFNKSNAKKAGIEIMDLFDNSNQATGTTVKIVIPISYSFVS